MNTDNFIERYFNVAMKIHSFCSDHAISKEYAKLYVYIFVKACESSEGVGYFEQECSTEIDALKSLICNTGVDALVIENPITPENLLDLYQTYVSRSIGKVEREIQLEYGFENVLHGELFNRLRLHTDPVFREEHIDFFTNSILPGISEYSEEMVKISTLNYQMKLAKEENEFNLLLD